MKKNVFLFCILLLIASIAKSDDIFDLTKISPEKFVFAAIPDIEFDYDKMERMLLTAIEISVENIVNRYSTRSYNSHFPYRYKYLFIFTDLSYIVKEKENYKIIYTPNHPDAIKDGELKGYTLYPDINISEEYNDIMEMIKILKLISDLKS
jgi:hypothetical protein